MGRVEGKIALVTGGAKGIGAATVNLLVEQGAKVVVTDIDAEAGRDVAAQIREQGGDAIFVHHDVADEASWVAVTRKAVEHYGRLDVLVNNAGIALRGDVEHATLADWRNTMSVNLDGVFLGTKHAVLTMKQNPNGGAIVNVSSVMGIVADPNLAAYNGSKGGVRNLTKSAALHCARAGYRIRVNSVHPGYIWTPMVQAGVARSDDPDERRRALEGLHPLGHLGEPVDIAYGILYLASDESRFMTGAELVIDGGYLAQ